MTALNTNANLTSETLLLEQMKERQDFLQSMVDYAHDVMADDLIASIISKGGDPDMAAIFDEHTGLASSVNERGVTAQISFLSHHYPKPSSLNGAILLEDLRREFSGNIDALEIAVDSMVQDVLGKLLADDMSNIADDAGCEDIVSYYDSRASSLKEKGMQAQLAFLLEICSGAEDIKASCRDILADDAPTPGLA